MVCENMTKNNRRQQIRKTLSLIMVILFPVIYYYFSPYLVIMGAAEGVIAGSLMVFLFLLLSSLFLGRAFCGWACPAGATQELCIKVNGKNFKGGKLNLIKYIIWAPWVSIIAIMFIQAGGIKTVNPLYQTYYGISITGFESLVMFLVIVGAIAGIALVAGRRAACHTICWMAPFMIIGSKIKSRFGYPSLRLSSDKNHCVQCNQCSKNCPMSLNVTEMVQNESMTNTECILCGSCVDTCPKNVINYSWKSKT